MLSKPKGNCIGQFTKLLPLVSWCHRGRSPQRQQPCQASLGAPGELGIGTAPSQVRREQWGSQEDSLEEAEGYLLCEE